MTHSLVLTDPEGDVIGYPAPIELMTYSQIQHDVGALHCRIGIEYLDLIDYEYRIEVWRRISPLSSVMMRTYFIETIEVTTDEQKRDELHIVAYDANALLKWRDIEAKAGSAAASKTDHADDIMRAIVREQLGASAADPISSSYFSVEADTHSGTSISVKMAWENVLQALREVSDASAGAGTRCFFKVQEGVGPAAYEFVVTTGQLGDDRSSTSDQPVYVGLNYGNVRSLIFSRDAYEEANHIISAGTGKNDSRVTAENIGARATQNVWSRKKLVYNDSAQTTTASLTAASQRRERENRPREKVQAELMEAPGFRYGYDWQFGDKLTLTHRGETYSGVVQAVTFWIYENGSERLQAVLEVET